MFIFCRYEPLGYMLGSEYFFICCKLMVQFILSLQMLRAWLLLETTGNLFTFSLTIFIFVV